MTKENLIIAKKYAEINIVRIFEVYRVIRPVLLSLATKWWLGKKFRNTLSDLIKVLDMVFAIEESK